MKEFYERIWKKVVEDKMEMVWSKNRKEKTMRIIKPFVRGNCLDVGCAYGMITNLLNEIVPTQGIDISSIAIKDAKRRYPHLKFKQGSAVDIPFTNNSFNTVFAGEIIEHVPDTMKLFSEFNRVLKKGGILIIITPQYNFIKNLIITLFFWEKSFDPFGEHVRFFSKKSLKKTLKQFGFKVIYEHTGMQYVILPQRMLIIAKKSSENKKIA